MGRSRQDIKHALATINKEGFTSQNFGLLDAVLCSSHRSFIVFTRCEVYFLLNIIMQIVLMQTVLDGDFVFLFFNWFAENWTNYRVEKSLTKIFPYLVNCKYPISGASGEKINILGVCEMQMSPIYKVIFLVLSFWFEMLFLLDIILLIRKSITILSINFRKITISQNTDRSRDLQVTIRWTDHYFILEIFRINLSSTEFAKMMVYLAKNLSHLFCESVVNITNKICIYY